MLHIARLFVGLVCLLSLLATGLAQAAAAPSSPGPDALKTLAKSLSVQGQMPASLNHASHWFNTKPLTRQALQGKVVLVDFWTYSCINCLRTLPYMNAWQRKYAGHGLVILGVHTPEFDFEKNINNVGEAIDKFDIQYPVAMDNDYAIWKSFNNHYWPADYFIDAKGRIRDHHFGEGGYHKAEDVIRALLMQAGYKHLPRGYVQPRATGIEAAAPLDQRSPETYIGYARARGMSQVAARNHPANYTAPTSPAINHWGLGGRWNVQAHHASLKKPGGKIIYRFMGRDLHLVMGPSADGKPVHFKVQVNGHAPGKNHGADVDADGKGVVTEQRLYQLVRLHDGPGVKLVTITFLDKGVSVYAFTFG